MCIRDRVTAEQLQAIAASEEAWRSLTDYAQELLKARTGTEDVPSGAAEAENLEKAAALAARYEAYVDAYCQTLQEKIEVLLSLIHI